MPDTAPSLRYAVIGDTHISPESDLEADRLRAIFSWLKGLDPPVDRVLHIGDIVECGFEEQFAAYDAIVPASLRDRIVHVPGNHETRWDEHANLSFLARYGSPPFSFDAGGVHFVGLDQTTTLQELGRFGEAQLGWLRDDLERPGRETPTVVFCHFPVGHPFYFVTDQDAFFDAIAPSNVVAIHAGHIHHEQVLVVNGITVATGWSLKRGITCHLVDREDDALSLYSIDLAGQEAMWTLLTTISLTTRSSRLPRVVGIEAIPGPGGDIDVAVTTQALPSDAVLRARPWPNHLYGSPDYGGVGWVDLAPSGAGQWAGRLPAGQVVPGRDRVEIVANTAAGGIHHRSAPMHVPSGDHPVLWEHPAGDGAVQAGIVTCAGGVLVATTAGEIARFDVTPEGAVERWRLREGHPYGSVVGTPAVVRDDRVIVGSRSGRVLALSARDGSVQWEVTLRAPVIAGITVSERDADGLVFVPCEGQLHAFDLSNGALRWVAGGDGFLGGRAAVDAHLVYASFGDGTLRAFDRLTGEQRWSRLVVERESRYSRLLYSAWAHHTLLVPSLVITSTVETLTAHDREHGEIAWSMPGSFMYAAGALLPGGQDIVLAGERGRVVRVDAATGAVRWEAHVGYTVLNASARVDGDTVYVPGAGAQLAMLDLATGRETGRVQLGGTALVSTPAITGDLLVAGGQDGMIRAMRR